MPGTTETGAFLQLTAKRQVESVTLGDGAVIVINTCFGLCLATAGNRIQFCSQIEYVMAKLGEFDTDRKQESRRY